MPRSVRLIAVRQMSSSSSNTSSSCNNSSATNAKPPMLNQSAHSTLLRPCLLRFRCGMPTPTALLWQCSTSKAQLTAESCAGSTATASSPRS